MDEPLSARERIWQVVAAIPPGKVASYGQIARLAGLGRGARQVGHTLRQLPNGSTLPWHRVINSQGKISLPTGSAGATLQRERLEAEGVEFTLAGKVKLNQFGWDA
jgi:methylated-DNA-protein-cysteine methyltransferase-like protein